MFDHVGYRSGNVIKLHVDRDHRCGKRAINTWRSNVYILHILTTDI